jgi:hypothetical protein
MHRGAGLRARAVALEETQPVDGEINLVATVILEDQKVAREPHDVQAREPAVTRDAVLHVHDEVADFEVGERAQIVLELLRGRLDLLLLGAEEGFLGHDQQGLLVEP